MFSKTIIAAFAATLFACANAHLAISNPAPIPGSNSKTPLDPSGSNFPCQGADLSGGSATSMAVGSSQPLKFDIGGNGENWAVHGGGSCQISITYETDAAKLKNPANWKVLHSWVGGCPTNAMLNLNPKAVACTGGNTECVVQDFKFTIPPEVKSGNAIMAWTWFNNIGNREMYMNCAKVTITGGSGDISGLPSMFAANIGNGCATSEQSNVDFPNPGKYITKDATLNYPLKAPVGSCGSGAGSGNAPSTPASTTPSSGSTTPPSSGSGAAAPAASSAKPSGGRGGRGSTGTFAEGAPASSPSAAAPVVPAPASAPASNVSSGTCKNGAVACSASGFYCIDATHFGECAFGCAVPMAMAPGTACANNAVAHAVASKRSTNLFANFFSKL